MPALLVLAAAVLFGTTGTSLALGAPDAEPAAAGAARVAVGGLALAAVALVARRRRPAPARRSTGARPWGGVAVVALGALAVLAYQPAFFTGVQANGVAVGTVVALGAGPLVAGVLERLLTGRPWSRPWLVATGVAVVGLVLLGLPGGPSGAAGGVAPLGLLASVAAGTAYAVLTVATKALLDRGWAPLDAVGAVFGGAGAVGALQLALTRPVVVVDVPSLVAVLWLGLATTTLAYALFVRGLAGVGAATAATLTLAEPVVAAALGLVVLGERVTGTGVAGLVLVAAALGVLALAGRRPVAEGAPVPTAAGDGEDGAPWTTPEVPGAAAPPSPASPPR